VAAEEGTSEGIAYMYLQLYDNGRRANNEREPNNNGRCQTIEQSAIKNKPGQHHPCQRKEIKRK
jgi:hypothetical protein